MTYTFLINKAPIILMAIIYVHFCRNTKILQMNIMDKMILTLPEYDYSIQTLDRNNSVQEKKKRRINTNVQTKTTHIVIHISRSNNKQYPWKHLEAMHHHRYLPNKSSSTFRKLHEKLEGGWIYVTRKLSVEKNM